MCKQFAATLPSHSAGSGNSALYRQQTAVPPQEQAMFANHDAQVIAMQNDQNHVECVDFHSSLHSQTVKEVTSEDLDEHLPNAFSPAIHVAIPAMAAASVHAQRGAARLGNGQPRTTVMIGNLPFMYSRQQLVEELHSLGFTRKTFDFLHLSEGKKGIENRGFAFVNFIQESTALQCFERVTGHIWKRHQSTDVKDAVVCWAAIQGYAENLKARTQAQRNSVLMASTTSSHNSRVHSAPAQQDLILQVLHL